MKNSALVICFVTALTLVKPANAQITSVSPNTVRQGEILDIEITTENFQFSQGTNFVILKQNNDDMYIYKVKTGNQANNFIVSTIFNNLYPEGNYDLHIKSNSDSKLDIAKTNALNVLPDLTIAVIDSISTQQARQGETIEMILYGTNTNFTKKFERENVVYLSSPWQNIHKSSLTVIDSVTLKVAFQFTFNHAPGVYSVNIENDFDGSLTLANAFELNEALNYPVITTVDPDTITQGQTLDIQITGQNINFMQGTNVVTLNNGEIEYYLNSVQALSNDTLRGGISVQKDAPPGDYNLSIWNSALDITLIANQTIIKENAFYLKRGTVGNDDIFLRSEKMLVFPNPAQKYIYLDPGIDEVSIFDSNGRIVLKSKASKAIDISGLKNGIYIVKTSFNGKLKSQKIIIE